MSALSEVTSLAPLAIHVRCRKKLCILGGFVLKKVLAPLVLLVLVGLCPQGAQAQRGFKDFAPKIEAGRALIKRITDEQSAQAENVEGLLALREQLEPARDDINEAVDALSERLSAAQAKLNEFGPPPAAGAPTEVTPHAAERQQLQSEVRSIENQLRSTRALLVEADQLWDGLTDARRDLFNGRIFQRADSVFYPRFWQRVFAEGVPSFVEKIEDLMDETDEAVTKAGAWTTLYGMLGFWFLSALTLWRVNHWLERRGLRASAGGDVAGTGQVILLAVIEFVVLAAPFLIMAAIVYVADARFEVLPDELDHFLEGLAGAIALYGVANAALRAVFSPRVAAIRVIRADDDTARRIVRVIDAMVLVYLGGLVSLGAVKVVSAPVSATIGFTALMAAGVVFTGALLLFRASRVDENAPMSGLVRAPLHLLRPLFWLLATSIALALSMGYVALAGLIVGRALASVIILCLAVLAYIAIDVALHQSVMPGTRASRFIAQGIGISPETVDLVGTILSGLFRLVVVVFTVLVLFSPWGLEFGNANPMQDVFFGVRFGDLRGWLGAAGVAIVLFAVGLVCTKLFVNWLEGQLLPRTVLNSGLQHSISTITGYAGFLIALTLALGQAGVQLQNIALVAGALSVGIGFGLQQIVSNFVAGLIVLAERPIRVGDVIVVKGEEGKVRKISVRATELSLGEKSTVIVPNADIISSIVKNRSFTDPTHRVTIEFCFVHEVEPAQVFEILLGAARVHPDVLVEPAPAVFVKKVSEQGIGVILNVICDRIGNMDAVRSDLYVSALRSFREQHILLARGDPPAPLPLPPPTESA